MKKVIAAGQYDNQRAFLFETREKTNLVRLIGKNFDEVFFTWRGTELTDGCYRNNIFVASTNEVKKPYIYVIENKSVRKIFTNGRLLTSVRFCADSRLVAVGDRGGRIYYIDLHTDKVTEEKLSDFGVEKPGRKLRRVNIKKNGYIICGVKQLCLDFHSHYMTNVGDFDFSEQTFEYAIQFKQEIWVSGLFQTYAVLFQLAQESIVTYEVPTDKNYAPLIIQHNSKLILAKEAIFYGIPGNWEKIHDFGEPTIIELVILNDIPNEVLCVGYTGTLEWITLP